MPPPPLVLIFTDVGQHTTIVGHARNRDVRHQCGIRDRPPGEWMNTRRTERNEPVSQMACHLKVVQTAKDSSPGSGRSQGISHKKWRGLYTREK
jgi:hypothetical protein